MKLKTPLQRIKVDQGLFNLKMDRTKEKLDKLLDLLAMRSMTPLSHTEEMEMNHLYEFPNIQTSLNPLLQLLTLLSICMIKIIYPVSWIG